MAEPVPRAFRIGDEVELGPAHPHDGEVGVVVREFEHARTDLDWIVRLEDGSECAASEGDLTRVG